MRQSVVIGDRVIEEHKPVFIIAEAGVNHNGDIALAKELIAKAKTAGADAIKFQAFRAELMCGFDLTETKDVETLTGGSNSSYEMYKRLELSAAELKELSNEAAALNILMFASVFDKERVDFLDSLNVPAFKISSGDVTHLPLINAVGQKKRPVILSTGMATLAEVEKAVNVIKTTGNNQIILLHCTADYPPRENEINLAVLETLRQKFSCPVGYSDHTRGTAIPFAAVALGAAVIEKHFTLSHDLPGPDHMLSLAPEEFQVMVEGIRAIEHAMGSAEKMPSSRERDLLFNSRRGIKASGSIKKGDILSEKNMKIIKPASGIPPEYVERIFGKRVNKDLRNNEPIEFEHVE